MIRSLTCEQLTETCLKRKCIKCSAKKITFLEYTEKNKCRPRLITALTSFGPQSWLAIRHLYTWYVIYTITALDLLNVYLQIPLKKETREKTAFITPDETGEFNRMIFGLTNVPFYFQKAINIALGNLRNSVAMCYLDDLLIPMMSDDGDSSVFIKRANFRIGRKRLTKSCKMSQGN